MEFSLNNPTATLASLASRVLQASESWNFDTTTKMKPSNQTGAENWPESYAVKQPEAWFDFEANHPHLEVVGWTIRNRHLSIYLGIIYFVLLKAGRRYMSDKQPYSLRGVLAAWNVFMALFSIAVTVRTVPYFLTRIFNLPLQSQVCHCEYQWSKVAGFWCDLFVLTKPMEFIDTLFIVLRKQHLHFLHWYHHITVVILCWYSLGVFPSPGNSIFYVAMNAFVHSVMYSYYCLRSARISVPRAVQMSITGMQIAQMVVGCFINLAALIYKLSGSKCDTLDQSTYLALAIYGSYFYLFCQFFYHAYFSTARKPLGVPPKQHSTIKVD